MKSLVGDGTNYVFAAGARPLTQWVLAVGVYTQSNKTGIVYVNNNTPVSAQNLSLGDPSVSNPVTAFGANASGEFSGYLDELRIYNRALNKIT